MARKGRKRSKSVSSSSKQSAPVARVRSRSVEPNASRQQANYVRVSRADLLRDHALLKKKESLKRAHSQSSTDSEADSRKRQRNKISDGEPGRSKRKSRHQHKNVGDENRPNSPTRRKIAVAKRQMGSCSSAATASYHAGAEDNKEKSHLRRLLEQDFYLEEEMETEAARGTTESERETIAAAAAGSAEEAEQIILSALASNLSSSDVLPLESSLSEFRESQDIPSDEERLSRQSSISSSEPGVDQVLAAAMLDADEAELSRIRLEDMQRRVDSLWNEERQDRAAAGQYRATAGQDRAAAGQDDLTRRTLARFAAIQQRRTSDEEREEEEMKSKKYKYFPRKE